MRPRLIGQGPGQVAANPSFTDIHLFMRALALAQTRGLKPHDIHSVEARWNFTHDNLVACGFILSMQGRERIYLEYCRDEASEKLSEQIVVERLAPDALYPRPSPHLPPVRWSTKVGHLNLRLPKVG
jgi:hypothetical protein